MTEKFDVNINFCIQQLKYKLQNTRRIKLTYFLKASNFMKE